jgi:trehalose 6-phosphate synthase
LYHGIFDTVHRPIFDARSYEAWAGYRAYNRSFAESIASHAASGATVVVNDYHLSLVGSELAALRPDVRTVQFSHTPFCSPDELSVLPRALSSELLGGLSSFGSCGFHTKRWADAYRSCARSLSIKTPPPFVAPLGIDTKKLRQSALSPGVVAHREAMVKEIAGRQCIVRSDRIELSKNIVRGFLAFEELLVQNPSLRDRVVFIARMYASREELPEYLAYRAEIEHVVERINDRFSECSRPPILASIGDDQDASLAALSLYDVLLVNSIRDGMNLVAKEGALLNRREGVLVLSHEAGAFVELGDSALDVSPFDVSGTAAVMKTALTMPASERGARAIALAKRASAHPPKNWIESVVAHAALPSPKRS